MSLSARLAGLLLIAFLAPGAALAATATEDLIRIDRRLPISLQAASSRFDGNTSQLSFEKVYITQGAMSIRADRGTAARLDFDNSRWFFEGNVVLDNQGATVRCDSAELTFVGHELRSAELRGMPATFEQQRPQGEPARGRAQVMQYDVSGATIVLSGDAWLSDGANEVTGERISYDITREYVTADAEGKGEVRMRIKPPEDREDGPAP
jgi:lipopolysaccharide export system protein LptA